MSKLNYQSSRDKKVKFHKIIIISYPNIVVAIVTWAITKYKISVSYRFKIFQYNSPDDYCGAFVAFMGNFTIDVVTHHRLYQKEESHGYRSYENIEQNDFVIKRNS